MYSICSICFTNSIDSIYSINSIGSIYSRYRFKIVECQNPECKWQKRESTRQLPTPETLWPQAYAATVTLNFESKVQCNCCQDIDTRLHKYTKVPKKLQKNTQLDKYRNETVEARHFGHLPLPAAGCHLKGTMHFGTVGVTYTNFRIKKHRNTDTTTKCQKKILTKEPLRMNS